MNQDVGRSLDAICDREHLWSVKRAFRTEHAKRKKKLRRRLLCSQLADRCAFCCTSYCTTNGDRRTPFSRRKNILENSWEKSWKIGQKKTLKTKEHVIAWCVIRKEKSIYKENQMNDHAERSREYPLKMIIEQREHLRIETSVEPT